MLHKMNLSRAVDEASPDEWIAFERLLADLAAVVGPQLVELASCVRHAIGRRHAALDRRVVA